MQARGTISRSIRGLTRLQQSSATDARARRARWGGVAALAVALAWWVVLAAAPVHAVCIVDTNGADDEPGQKDLSQICLVGACTGGINESLSFDDRAWSGNNTGDACFLFDTDSDGLVNRALCVTLTGDPVTQTGNARCYTCADTRPDRCVSSVLVSCTSVCSLSSTSDPFALDPNHIGNKCHEIGRAHV